MKTVLLSIAVSIFIFNLYAQTDLPVIRSTTSLISIRDGKNLKLNSWRLAPEAKPDIYKADLIDGKPHRVTFLTDVDSISFMVEDNKVYDFIIQWDDKKCFTQIIGQRFIPSAVFNADYQKQHQGKILVEIPEVYELVNIAIALTSFGIENKNFVYQNSQYYEKIRDWFDEYRDHKLILTMDSVLTRNSGYYGTLKMNGYAFEFDQNDLIIQSPVYDRTGFRYERANSLKPYFDLLNSFSKESRFRQFYRENLDIYAKRISFFTDTVNTAEMKKWLDFHFPESSDYDSYKIIFSPLVSYNQSSTWFESNGFRELQPHVNFPYRQDIKQLYPLSKEAEIIYRGNIVFTEINHGYINPESDKYADRISKAISNREKWVDKSRAANYYRGNAAFIEYMNWGLVTLRIVDYVAREEQEKLIARVERMMVKNRSFIKFKEYNRFLIELYVNRGEEMTIADLYPQIINWFKRNN